MLDQNQHIIFTTITSALICATIVLIRSIQNFSRTGPQIKDEVHTHYFSYTIYAIGRLYLYCFLLCFVIALPGVLLAFLYVKALPSPPFIGLGVIAGIISVGLLTFRQFTHCLFYNPGIIITSLNFDPIRLFPLYGLLSRNFLNITDACLLLIYCGTYGYLFFDLLPQQALLENTALALIPLTYALTICVIRLNREPTPSLHTHSHQQRNIVMIGSDTLRADHLGIYGYNRDTTPFIDSLAQKSTVFKQCYVPLARTAPSLVSLFTGCWPGRHKITTNYASDDMAKSMDLPTLGSILKQHHYQTSTVGDWSGADLGKFNLGFERRNLPDDQWNIKYLIKQGPKDIRLLLSIFCHNKIGRLILPEIYYLAGVPLTEHIGRDARREITSLAKGDAPFFLNVFMGTTHPPFPSNHPYFSLFTDPGYKGKSKFCMSRLTTPEEIIESQQEPKEAFDLDQVIDLYDGAIRQFDDEVKKITNHLQKSGLMENTIVVIYSDHGIDFFENDTWGQGNSISSDASAHIPLIIHSPDILEPSSVDNKVRSIDIMPTLLDLCGIQSTSTIDGSSLVTSMKGVETPVDLPIIFETGLWLTPPPKQRKNHITYPDIFHLLEVPDKKSGTLALKGEYSSIIETARDWFIWKENWKLKCHNLKEGPQYGLFNTNDDPNCATNVASQHPDIVQELITVKALTLI